MKKYIFAVILILSCLLIVLIPKKQPELSYEYLEETAKITVYYVSDNKIIGVEMKKVSTNKYEAIEEVFLYLTANANSSNYSSYLNLSTRLVSYEIRRDTIYLNVSNDFFRVDEENVNLLLAQILYSYQELGYKEVYLKSDDKIKTINGKKYNRIIDYHVGSICGFMTIPNGVISLPNVWFVDENGFKFLSKGLVHIRFSGDIPEWYLKSAKIICIDVVEPCEIGEYVRMCEEDDMEDCK